MVNGRGDIWQILPIRVKIKNGEKLVYPPLADGIRQASVKFHERFGVWPTLIQCNPKQLEESGIVDEKVKPDKYIPSYAVHCWGIPESEGQ